MKFIKKAAALFFCAALALSVMAVSALADDAELLGISETGNVTNDNNPDFTVMLTKNDSHIPNSRDSVAGYEIVPSDTITFDITVAYNYDSNGGRTDFRTANKTIDAFQFEFNPDNNFGAEIQQVLLNHKQQGNDSPMSADVTEHTGTPFDNNGAYENIYSYSSGDPETDIPLPAVGPLELDSSTDKATGGTVIGSITLKFNHATQAINIYPQIENLLIHVRNTTEAAQIPSAATPVTETLTDVAGTITGGKRVTYTLDDETETEITSPASKGAAHGCVIKAPIPVIVNPIYNVTVINFRNNPTTGIAEKIPADTQGATLTATYQYDFLNGTFGDADNDYEVDSVTTALPFTELYGYTLQGWMVTEDTYASPAWKPWSEDTTNNSRWDATRSFPATTTAQNSADSGHWVVDTWFISANKIEWEDNFADNYNSTTKPNQTNVNFIEVDKTDGVAANYTTFPAGLVGNVTLTPVYTRDVYTATFDSGDDDATFSGESFTAAQDNVAPKHWKRTYEYTIEDLTVDKAVNGNVYDFLTLNDPNGETALRTYLPADESPAVPGNPAGPQGLARKAYKFMGWSPASADGVAADYQWERDVVPGSNATTELVPTSDYNSVEILKTANRKHYGNVTFTAVWEEDIYYAEIAYQYAGADNVLVLVGVPSGEGKNYDADYTYQFKPSSSASANVQKMFLVPDSDQRTAYVDATKTSSGTGVTEAFPTDGLSGDYVLFAYIAAPDDVTEHSVTIDEAETNATESNGTKCANYVLNYNGDIDNSGGISVVDFGNVDTLLNSPLTADTENVFVITNYFGVRARLQADVDAGMNDDGKLAFGNIRDVKTIYSKMGYDT